MILPSKRAPFWRRIALGLLAVLAVSLALYLRATEAPSGGTAMGRAYGIAAALLVVLLFGLPLRRRAYRSKLGTVDGWLQAHLYLGLVALALAFAHGGGRFGDRVAVAALAVMVGVVVTGVAGARLYAIVPRRLSRIEGEMAPEQLAEAIEEQRRTLGRIAAGRSSAFQAVYRQLDRRLLPGPLAGWRVLIAGGRRRDGDDPPAPLLAAVPAAERAALEALQHEARRAIELRRALESTQRLRNLLEVWRYLHLPLATVLLVLILAHTVAAAYFGAG